MSSLIPDIITYINKNENLLSKKLPKLNGKKLIQSLKSLDELIGMQDTKISVVDQLRYLIDNNGNTGQHLLHTILRGPPGCGKCVAIGTKVLLYPSYNSVKVDIIKPGDLLVGDDHTPRKVQSICQGYGELYTVLQDSGFNYSINSEHIISLYNLSQGKIIDLSLDEYFALKDCKNEYRGVACRPTTTKTVFATILSNIINIVPIGKGDYFGFELDGNGRFLLEDYTITHNTSLSLVLADIWDSLGILGSSSSSSTTTATTSPNPSLLPSLSLIPITSAIRNSLSFPPPSISTGGGGGGGGASNNSATSNNKEKSPLVAKNSDGNKQNPPSNSSEKTSSKNTKHNVSPTSESDNSPITPDKIIHNFCQVLDHTMIHKEDIYNSLRSSIVALYEIRDCALEVRNYFRYGEFKHSFINPSPKKSLQKCVHDYCREENAVRKIIPVNSSSKSAAREQRISSATSIGSTDAKGKRKFIPSKDRNKNKRRRISSSEQSKDKQTEIIDPVYFIDLRKSIPPIFQSITNNELEQSMLIVDENNFDSVHEEKESETNDDSNDDSDDYSQEDNYYITLDHLNNIIDQCDLLLNNHQENASLLSGTIVAEKERTKYLRSWADCYEESRLLEQQQQLSNQKQQKSLQSSTGKANQQDSSPRRGRIDAILSPLVTSIINNVNSGGTVPPSSVQDNAISPSSNPTTIHKTKVKVVSRIDFVAEYLGQTAIKTKKLLESMEGGVLIVEEAYSLYNGDRDSFGVEAINCLTQWMSEHPTSIIFIFLGYKDSLERSIFAANKGMERRFGWIMDIPKYSAEELTLIFRKQLLDSPYRLNAIADSYLQQFIKENMAFLKHYGGDTFKLIFHCKLVYSRHRWAENITTVDSQPNEKESIKPLSLDSNNNEIPIEDDYKLITKKMLIEAFQDFKKYSAQNDTDKNPYIEFMFL